MYDDAFFKADSLSIVQSESAYDIIYNDEVIIMSVTDLDALWFNKPAKELANDYTNKIRADILSEKEENSVLNLLKRIGYVLLLLLGIWLLVYGINRLFKRVSASLTRIKKNTFAGLASENTGFISSAALPISHAGKQYYPACYHLFIHLLSLAVILRFVPANQAHCQCFVELDYNTCQSLVS